MAKHIKKYEDENPKKDYADYRKDNPAKKISPGETPKNLDTKNKKISQAELYAESIQNTLDGWIRNIDKITKLIKTKLDQLDKEGADNRTKEFYVKKILRIYGGPAAIDRNFTPKI